MPFGPLPPALGQDLSSQTNADQVSATGNRGSSSQSPSLHPPQTLASPYPPYRCRHADNQVRCRRRWCGGKVSFPSTIARTGQEAVPWLIRRQDMPLDLLYHEQIPIRVCADRIRQL